MTNRSTQLSRSVITFLVISLSLSFLTGLGLWYVHEQREALSRGDISELPQWTSACQITHGILNPLITALFGYLWFYHVRGGWKMRVNRKSGGTLNGLMIVLIATGVGLYYGEGSHFWFTLHLLAGLLIVFVFPLHWRSARNWVRGTERTSVPRGEALQQGANETEHHR